jgi:hypothetical protein
MGFRFRKRLRIFSGLWVNLSKRGGSVGIGGRGATINLSPKGHKPTVGLPGSGLSYAPGGGRSRSVLGILARRESPLRRCKSCRLS